MDESIDRLVVEGWIGTWVNEHERLAKSWRGRYVRYVGKVAIICELYRVRDKLTSRQTECRRQL